MVLQQFSHVNFWGRAAPQESIVVYTSWNNKSYPVTADPEGNWKLQLFTGGPGGPYTITFTARNKVEIRDVMVGEVWVCSGQSNMEFTFRDLGGWKSYSSMKRQFDTSDFQKIRLCTIGKQAMPVPSDSCNAKWVNADSSSVLNFSATAFYFGLDIYKKFNIPVGLIVSSWGGTPAEAWTPVEYLRNIPGLSYYLNHPNNPSWEASAPSVLFNGMVYPLRNYTIKGFIWYQGESNRYDPDLYGILFRSMILSWRKYWDNMTLPFYFVQIAPYDYADYDEASGYLREAQEKALKLDYTGMAVTLDIGNLKDIHPKNKEEVGYRLALLAFARTYSQALRRSAASPLFRFARTEVDRIQVYFKDVDFLYSKGDRISGFRIAGSDGVFKPADAVIAGSSVIVHSNDVPSPKYVRYAFLNTDTASIFDQWGLPAASFRTDSIPVNFREVHISAVFNPLKKNWRIGLTCPDPAATLRYTADGSLPSLTSAIYTDTITIDASREIKAKAFLKEIPSQSTSAISIATHEAVGCIAGLKFKPSSKYKGSAYTLTDGISGSRNFHDGCWLGFQGDDFEAVIDLGQEKQIGSVRINFLIDILSQIYPPGIVSIFTSKDGHEFKKARDFKPNDTNPKDMPAKPEVMEIAGRDLNLYTRYIKVYAKNQASNPSGHLTPGQKCWLFVDEVKCEK